jgi:hypothetical protein
MTMASLKGTNKLLLPFRERNGNASNLGLRFASPRALMFVAVGDL